MVLCAGDEIQLTLVRGKALKACDSNNLSDPFVTLESSTGQKFKSKTIKDTLNPEWNEKFTFKLDSSENFMLVMQGYDLDIIKNDFLGSTTITISDDKYEIGKEHEVELPLHATTTGSLVIRFTIVRK